MTQIVFADSVGTGIRYSVGTGASLYVSNNVTVGSTDSDAIAASGNAANAMIFGSVFGLGAGITLGNQAGSSANLMIGDTGIVAAQSYAVSLYNAGSHLTNAGQVMSNAVGVLISANAGAAVRIYNSGSIHGDHDGLFNSFSQQLVLVNTGTISTVGGNSYLSASGATGVDIIHNHGSMIGDIWLAGGHDLYDGRGGTVDGTVYGEGEDDTFVAGLSAEVFDGGSGNDLLDFSRSSGVTASLDNTVQGTRGAEGDLYLNIENLTGSGYGNDILYGSAADNQIMGQGGADVLAGGFGNDRLTGGAGKDVLYGGMGNDTFLFHAASEGGDKINDFSVLVGNHDVIWLDAAGFGAGLVAGALTADRFQMGTDTVALSAGVRLLFDTTDSTLWFDANGSAAGGLTMIADLQAGAVVALADLFLF